MVDSKAERNQNITREIAAVKRDVRLLQQDCEDLK